MKFTQSKRGLLRAVFQDRYGQMCSLQESSHPGEDCLWAGVEVDQHGQDVSNGRMHLTREQARNLIPMLRHFARTGRLGEDHPHEHFQIGAWVVGVGEGVQGIEGRIVQLQKGDPGHLAVQDHNRSGPEGLHHCTWAMADLIWVPINQPDEDNRPSALARLLEDHADD